MWADQSRLLRFCHDTGNLTLTVRQNLKWSSEESRHADILLLRNRLRDDDFLREVSAAAARSALDLHRMYRNSLKLPAKQSRPHHRVVRCLGYLTVCPHRLHSSRCQIKALRRERAETILENQQPVDDPADSGNALHTHVQWFCPGGFLWPAAVV